METSLIAAYKSFAEIIKDPEFAGLPKPTQDSVRDMQGRVRSALIAVVTTRAIAQLDSELAK